LLRLTHNSAAWRVVTFADIFYRHC
jgi:hypothetical protein